jgi:hypothetical protein
MRETKVCLVWNHLQKPYVGPYPFNQIGALAI